jgi:hypothetical protein
MIEVSPKASPLDANSRSRVSLRIGINQKNAVAPTGNNRG